MYFIIDCSQDCCPRQLIIKASNLKRNNIWTQEPVKSNSKEMRHEKDNAHSYENNNIILAFNMEENNHIHSQRPLEASQDMAQNYNLNHKENVKLCLLK